MTKIELIEELKGLPDDTVIYTPEYEADYYNRMVTDFCVEIRCDGSDGCQAKVYLR